MLLCNVSKVLRKSYGLLFMVLSQSQHVHQIKTKGFNGPTDFFLLNITPPLKNICFFSSLCLRKLSPYMKLKPEQKLTLCKTSMCARKLKLSLPLLTAFILADNRCSVSVTCCRTSPHKHWTSSTSSLLTISKTPLYSCVTARYCFVFQFFRFKINLKIFH